MSGQTTTTPVFHYLRLGRHGRGEVVRLLLKDAGIDFEDIRYVFDDTWSSTKIQLQKQGLTKTGKLPALQYKGHALNQHIPILRYLARDLGQYDGETTWDKYVVDAVSDIYVDWRFKWVANLGNVTEHYKSHFAPEYYAILSTYYSDRNGPYLLGQKITYADFAVYQSMVDDQRIGALPVSLPSSMVKFKETFEKRPNITRYITQCRDPPQS
ncbi:DDE superfamily endonuclease, CENP-B-like protein [Purpureocillium lavendulum]|uniref:DDE superfamily endonuclease, CENP-B-like protein n=1 Tax=Purpureocillium lavendulum TaxID=1247861 RepID=A0AB34FGK9_9HYPO|nr:DDE superfamily endonuclease, CENP-B-like protein [Purpureocillium lavendulum]